MKRLSNRTGSMHIVAVLAVIVVALTAIAGYRVYQLQYGNKAPESAGTMETAKATVPDSINTSSDLKQAEDALDADKSDQNLDPSQLDADLNNLP